MSLGSHVGAVAVAAESSDVLLNYSERATSLSINGARTCLIEANKILQTAFLGVSSTMWS